MHRASRRANSLRTVPRTARVERGGAVLFVVLVIVVMLLLAAYQFAATMTSECASANRFSDRIRLRSGVDSGLAYVAVHLDSNRCWELYDSPTLLRDRMVGDDSANAPRFSILATGGGRSPAAKRFGLVDESAKLNVNVIVNLPDADARRLLLSVPGMTNDIAAAILDWIDADDAPRENGAERESYSHRAQNGGPPNRPLESLEELLLVRDVTPELLFGEDANRNGRLDESENDGPASLPMDNADGVLNRGWRDFLTVESAESNRQPDGRPKINLNSGDLAKLYDELAEQFEEGVAEFVIAYRLFGPGNEQRSRLQSGSPEYGESESSPDERSITAPPQNRDADEPASAGSSGSRNLREPIFRGGMDLSGGPKCEIRSLFDLVGIEVNGQQDGITAIQESPFPAKRELMLVYLPELFEKLTCHQGRVVPGRININRARRELLEALPGMSYEAARTIVLERQSTDGVPHDTRDEKFRTPGWLFVIAALSLEELRSIGPYITTHGDRYRFQVLCRLPSKGQFVRVEALVDATARFARVCEVTDLTHLGRGFPTRDIAISDSP